MASSTSADLLQASLTGNLPSDAQQAFTSEREKGNAAYRQGRYEEAIEHYTKAEVINPLSPLPPANRSMVYIKQEKWQKAREEAAIALELQNALPKHLHSDSLTVKLLLRRATACTKLMLYALAVDDYQSIVHIDPSHTVAKQHLFHLNEKYGINILPSTSPSTAANRSINFQTSNSNNDSSTSRKPLVRILDDTNDNNHIHNQSKSSNGHHTTNRSNPKKNNDKMQDDKPFMSLSKETITELALQSASQIPQSSSQFEHAWRTLRHDSLSQAGYLIQSVGAEQIHFIAPCFTPELLERIVHVLNVYVSETASDSVNVKKICKLLLAISKIERFPLLMMFMSDSDRQPFQTLVHRLQQQMRGVDEEDDIMHQLKSAFG